MQHRSRPHRKRYKRPKYPSGKMPYVAQDDERFNGKNLKLRYINDCTLNKCIKRAERWWKHRSNPQVHRAPRHIREKLAIVEASR